MSASLHVDGKVLMCQLGALKEMHFSSVIVKNKNKIKNPNITTSLATSIEGRANIVTLV